ncbi:MAG TPA: hypothetical protein VFJ19_09435 [Nocardioidaceae bacterium]|nr:hypothetical protein [Nocardioidaceae bacterium]
MSETCRCGDRGWVLDDGRVTPCDCPAADGLDLPKWATRGDRACVVAHRHDPERPRRAATGCLCAGCFGRLERTIAELPARHDALVSALIPAQGGGGRVSGTPESRLPIVTSERPKMKVGPAADHRDAIAHTLASWAALLVEEHNTYTAAVHAARLAVWKDAYLACTTDLGRPVWVPIRPPRDVTVRTTAALLVVHLAWAAGQPWVTDLLDEVGFLSSRALRLTEPDRQHRVEVGGCGDCPGVLWLVGDADEGRSMSCDTCGRTVEPRYWRKERKRLDGTDVNPWLPLDIAAMQYGVTTRTMQRWVEKGRLKARGRPALVRASAVEGLMHGLREVS